MPILVQWKWNERTKTFLVIFSFTDDYSKTNLRMRYVSYMTGRKEAMMTWAPSHVEVGLLSEILRYANIINGLGVIERRELKDRLQGHINTLAREIINIGDEVEPKMILVKEYLETGEVELIIELCPNYIDYLRKLLRPYLKD